MRNHYRGMSNKANPFSLEVSEAELLGNPRGFNRSEISTPAHIPKCKPKSGFSYKGNTYLKCSVIETETSFNNPLVPVPENVVERSNVCVVEKTVEKSIPSQLEKAAEVHLNNIRKQLNHRLRVAKARGDEYLVNLLENESTQLA